MKRWGWAAPLVLLVALAGAAEASRTRLAAAAAAHNPPGAPEAEKAPSLFFGQIDSSTIEHFLGKKRGVEQAAVQEGVDRRVAKEEAEGDATPQKAEEGGEKKETIAKVGWAGPRSHQLPTHQSLCRRRPRAAACRRPVLTQPISCPACAGRPSP